MEKMDSQDYSYFDFLKVCKVQQTPTVLKWKKYLKLSLMSISPHASNEGWHRHTVQRDEHHSVRHYVQLEVDTQQ